MYAAIIICLVSPSLLFAQQPENPDELKTDFIKASAVTNDEKRLQEYDKIAVKYGLVKKETAPVSKWTENVSINPLDDARTVVLMNDESSESLIIRHSLGKQSLYISCEKYLGLDSTVVTYRIGKADAQTDVWSISSDHKAVFFSGDVDALLKQMAEAGTFVSQITPYGEVPITTVFDIRGLKQFLIKYKDDFGDNFNEDSEPKETIDK
jgi:type VI secretion system protein VasI